MSGRGGHRWERRRGLEPDEVGYNGERVGRESFIGQTLYRVALVATFAHNCASPRARFLDFHLVLRLLQSGQVTGQLHYSALTQIRNLVSNICVRLCTRCPLSVRLSSMCNLIHGIRRHCVSTRRPTSMCAYPASAIDVYIYPVRVIGVRLPLHRSVFHSFLVFQASTCACLVSAALVLFDMPGFGVCSHVDA